jgi:hypothetical protein
MKVFIFGSQKLWSIMEKIDIIEITNNNNRLYSNNIGQYIQELNQIQKKIIIPSENFEYMYPKDVVKMLKKNTDEIFNDLLSAYNKADYIIVELQNFKYSKKDNYFVDPVLYSKINSSATNNDSLNHTKDEFLLLLRTFTNLIRKKKICFVGTIYHDSSNLKKINFRMVLNSLIYKFVANNFEKTYFINPSNIFDLYEWSYIMKDSNHCTEDGDLIVKEYIRAELEYLCENITQETTS